MDKRCFWSEVFTDVDGTFSFKRVQTGLFTLLFVIIIVANVFFKKSIDTTVMTCLGGLLGAGYTGIAIEKFTNRGKDDVTSQ